MREARLDVAERNPRLVASGQLTSTLGRLTLRLYKLEDGAKNKVRGVS